MKTIKEYYKKALDESNSWLEKQTSKWWESDEYLSYLLDTNGDYIETVKFLSIEEKNDLPILRNHTNVKNSDWCILYDMMTQAVIDWCMELKEDDRLWNDLNSIYISIRRGVVDGKENQYAHSISIKNYDSVEEDESRLNLFVGCEGFLCDIIDWFMTKHGKNVPNNWNRISFGIDNILASCENGEWVPSSDTYFGLEQYDDQDEDKYISFVECM